MAVSRPATSLFAVATAAVLVAALGACGDSDAEALPPAPAAAASSEPSSPSPTTASPTPSFAPASLDGVVPDSVAEGYELAWRDEFSGTELGPDWRFRDSRAENRACSPPDAGQAEVSDGKVHLSVSADESKTPNVTRACPDGQYLNAMIGTAHAQNFRYGIFTARLKFEEPQGAHGSFWMQPRAKAPDAQPGDAAANGTEIDIIEYFGEGYSKGGLASFVYYPTIQKNGELTRIKSGGLLPDALSVFDGELPSDDYHVYSVEWTPEHYVFRIDGVETYRLEKGVSGVEQYLILSLLSSDYELPELPDGALPMSMSVDWVRVWQQ